MLLALLLHDVTKPTKLLYFSKENSFGRLWFHFGAVYAVTTFVCYLLYYVSVNLLPEYPVCNITFPLPS